MSTLKFAIRLKLMVSLTWTYKIACINFNNEKTKICKRTEITNKHTISMESKETHKYIQVDPMNGIAVIIFSNFYKIIR